jgi:hypothetical protein
VTKDEDCLYELSFIDLIEVSLSPLIVSPTKKKKSTINLATKKTKNNKVA